MKKTLIVCATIVLLLVAVFVWPTRYRRGYIGKLPVREDRFTGKTEVFYPSSGWVEAREKGILEKALEGQ